ncbi:MAG: VTT domain-containing protein [Candidatus Pacebacteria bacterium]|nr:VTT domain-containing protein [Candidatus Paceibacterota bacterium]
MAFIVNSLLSFLLLYKYIALFVIVAVSAFIVPFPVSTVFLASGAFASQGYFSFSLAVIVSLFANVFGDVLGYVLSRTYGSGILRIFKIRVSSKFAYVEEKLRHNSSLTIFLTRFSAPLSIATNFVSGFVRISYLNFFISDLVGNIFSDIPVIYGGYIAGSYWQEVSGFVDTIGAIVLVVILIVLIFIFSRRKNTASLR